MSKTRLTKTPRERAKFHESIVNHPDVNVRLAADQIAQAFLAAKSGNTVDMATFIRLAGSFEHDMSIPAKLGYAING